MGIDTEHANDLMEWKELPDKLLLTRDAEVSGRCFLNTVESEHSGSWKYNMEVRKKRRPKSSKRKGFWYSLWGTIQIRDCSRQIILSLDGHTRNAAGLKLLENTERKLRKMRMMCDKQLEVITRMKQLDADG